MPSDSLSGRSKQRLSPENKAMVEGCEFSLYVRSKGKLFCRTVLKDSFQRKLREGGDLVILFTYSFFKHDAWGTLFSKIQTTLCVDTSIHSFNQITICDHQVYVINLSQEKKEAASQ